MADAKHLSILEQGAAAWNAWRASHPGVHPDLAKADLSEVNLEGVNLSEADFSEADLYGVNFRNANLKMAIFVKADLSGADLSGASAYKARFHESSLTQANLSEGDFREVDFQGADLRGATVRQTDLGGTDLSSSNLSDADMTGANLSDANIADANLFDANLDSANVTGLRYGSLRSMRGHFYGTRGLSSCSGNALFVRDAQDQDYLDTVAHSIERTEPPLLRQWKHFWFRAWGLIDYGRSLSMTFSYAFALSMGFGALYSLDMGLEWGLMDYSGSARSWFTPFYYSIVTYTTLGFGDITPQHWLGEIIIVSEVVLGYLTLGLLLSILANRVARRS